MMKEKSKQYNLLKAIATVLVVIGHSSRMYTDKGVVTLVNSSAFLSVISECIYAFHMPLFVAISGMIYGICVDDYGKYKNIKAFICGKAKRLLIPYVIWGGLYVAPVMTIWDFSEMSYPAFMIRSILLLDDPRHLWYVVVLFEIFAICGILKNQIIRIPNKTCFLLLLLCLSCISSIVPDFLLLKNLSYYMFFFFIGYVVNLKYNYLICNLKKFHVMLVLSLITITLFAINFRPTNIVRAVAVIGLILGITGHLDTNKKIDMIINSINRNSFGIYLLHPMILYVLYYYFAKCDMPPILLFTCITSITWILSYGITTLIRKSHLGIIIGE